MRLIHFAPGAALALGLALAPARAEAASLYIAWQTGHEGGVSGEVGAFGSCVIGATKFNEWLAAFPGGEQMTLKAVAEIGDCGLSFPDFTCVVNSAGWEVEQGDVVEYIHAGGCAGYNDHGITVTTPSGKAVGIRGADLGDGFIGNCHCQTALGMHEIYEAAGDAQ